MTGDLPSLEDVRGLIASRKPPLAARVVELREGAETRSASVIFDGINAWLIDDGVRVELRAAEDRATFLEAGTVERVGPGMLVSSNAWVKTALDGRRLANLDVMTGEVLGREETLGRDCWVVRAEGLKREDAAFTLHVDAATGVLVRTGREDADTVLEVQDLRIGTVELPSARGVGDPGGD